MNNQLIYQYLGGSGRPDEKLARLVDECARIVREAAKFRAVYKKFTLSHGPLTIKELGLVIDSDDLENYLSGCDECIVIACTLGFETDRRIKFYQHIDMAKAVVIDRAASRYLEQMRDEFERENFPSPYTFRFAPGYGDIPLGLNLPLSKALDSARTIGVNTSEGGTFTPQKSMLGIVGLGKDIKKDCMSCIRKDSCALRKEGKRCYATD